MKRTAKWQETLTLKQLRHLSDMQALGLHKFKQLRVVQRDIAKRLNEPLWRICPECDEIERRLKVAGHHFDEIENAHSK